MIRSINESKAVNAAVSDGNAVVNAAVPDGNAVVNAVVPDENSEDVFVIW